MRSCTQWKGRQEARDKAERALDRAINGPRPRPPPALQTPAQLACTARKTRKIALSARLEDHGLNCVQTAVCEEYNTAAASTQWSVMIEMEFFVTRTQYSEVFDQIVDEFRACALARRTPRSRDVGVSRALGQG
jgi:hypothetical protein